MLFFETMCVVRRDATGSFQSHSSLKKASTEIDTGPEDGFDSSTALEGR
jgi:hypothetical protein